MIIFVHFYFPFSVHCYIIIYINEELIYEILSVVEEIPKGKVATYGQIARLLEGIKMHVLLERFLVIQSFMGNIHVIV